MTYPRTQRFWGATALLAGAALLAGTLAIAHAEDKKADKPMHGPKAEHREGGGERKFDGEKRRGHGPGMDLLHGLDLTEEQKAKLQTIHQEARKSREAWQAEHKEEIDDLKAQMQALQEKMRALHETAPKLEDNLDKIREVLTPEQRAKFNERVEEMKKRREEHGPRGEGMRRPDGEMKMHPRKEGEEPAKKREGEGKKELEL